MLYSGDWTASGWLYELDNRVAELTACSKDGAASLSASYSDYFDQISHFFVFLLGDLDISLLVEPAESIVEASIYSQRVLSNISVPQSLVSYSDDISGFGFRMKFCFVSSFKVIYELDNDTYL